MRWRTTSSVDYTAPLGGDWSGYGRIEHSWQSRDEPVAAPELVAAGVRVGLLKAYHSLNLRLGARSDVASVELFGENIVGKIPAVGFRQLFTQLNGDQQIPRPRVLGLRMTRRF